MTLADTSVIVAAFASWHEQHDAADAALGHGEGLIAHCALETYSTLTRLPAPGRAESTLVLDFLRSRFEGPYLTLSPSGHESLMRSLSSTGISGGATYDALVAATVAEARADLVSCDRRALPTYEAFGIGVQLLDS